MSSSNSQPWENGSLIITSLPPKVRDEADEGEEEEREEEEEEERSTGAGVYAPAPGDGETGAKGDETSPQGERGAGTPLPRRGGRPRARAGRDARADGDVHTPQATTDAAVPRATKSDVFLGEDPAKVSGGDVRGSTGGRRVPRLEGAARLGVA